VHWSVRVLITSIELLFSYCTAGQQNERRLVGSPTSSLSLSLFPLFHLYCTVLYRSELTSVFILLYHYPCIQQIKYILAVFIICEMKDRKSSSGRVQCTPYHTTAALSLFLSLSLSRSQYDGCDHVTATHLAASCRRGFQKPSEHSL